MFNKCMYEYPYLDTLVPVTWSENILYLPQDLELIC